MFEGVHFCQPHDNLYMELIEVKMRFPISNKVFW